MAARTPIRPRSPVQIIVGIDTGGTFTDLVAKVGGEVKVHKLLSTPHDPAEAVVAGIKALLQDRVPQLVKT